VTAACLWDCFGSKWWREGGGVEEWERCVEGGRVCVMMKKGKKKEKKEKVTNPWFLLSSPLSRLSESYFLEVKAEKVAFWLGRLLFCAQEWMHDLMVMVIPKDIHLTHTCKGS
jgi:hypothetical protein